MNSALPSRSSVLVPAGVTLVAAVVTLTATLLIGGGVGDGGGDGDTGARATAERKGTAGRGTAAAAHGARPAAAPVPYVRLSPGDCFDHPGLSSTARATERRSCAKPHDAEVVAQRELKGTVHSEQRLQKRASALCATPAERRLKKIPQDGRGYRTFTVHPSLETYRQHHGASVTCALTLGGDRQGGAHGTPEPKLTAPLPRA